MLDYEERQNHFCRDLLLLFLSLALMIVLCGCSFHRVQLNGPDVIGAFASRISFRTNIPLGGTKVTVFNNTPGRRIVLQINGDQMCVVPSNRNLTVGYWTGSGPYNSTYIQLPVALVDYDHNWSWSDVFMFSSYYPPSYILTVREDENGKLYVERR